MKRKIKIVSASFFQMKLLQFYFLKSALFHWWFAGFLSTFIFSGNSRSDRNAELQSGVDQVTCEQSFCLNASVYQFPLKPPPPTPQLSPHCIPAHTERGKKQVDKLDKQTTARQLETLVG